MAGDHGSADISFRKRSQAGDIVRRFIKNKAAIAGFIIMVILLAMALFPQLFTRVSYEEQVLSDRLQGPSQEHWFGTDDFGRDIFSRVIYGARISLKIGSLSVLVGCITGMFIGCIAGYYGRFTDNIAMRMVDILLAIPSILLAMSVVAALGISQTNLILALGLGSTGSFARILRAQILTIKEQEFIEASHAIGANDIRIILKHLVPNSMAPIIVHICGQLGSNILAMSAMSFIGLGIPPPIPEWGGMLNAGRHIMRDHWYVVTFPGIAIMLAVFAFNLFGDGLRDALDPRLKS